MDEAITADILRLLEAGLPHARRAVVADDLHEEERAARCALGYLEAANALLNRNAHLHDKLIEHPHFIRMRRLLRPFGSLGL